MKHLYVLYDAKCDLCRRVRAWLGVQPAFVPLVFVPLQSEDLEARFPGVSALEPSRQILVVADNGDVWRGEDAWIVCLWALRDYREWSARMAGPMLRPFARKLCAFVSRHRRGLGDWLFGQEDKAVAAQLAGQPEECIGACAVK